MRFTSLDDAWGDISNHHQQDAVDEPNVSAKKTTVHIEKQSETLVETKEPEISPVLHKIAKQTDKIITEIEFLRIEENKRFTIYVIIACILFAMLLWYIDKLNNKITYLMMMQWKQSNLKQ